MILIGTLVVDPARVPGQILLTVGYLWIGAACSANWLRCRRTHCVVMGPAFLILGLMRLGNLMSLWSVGGTYIRNAAFIAIILGFLPEFFGKKYLG